MEANNAHAGKFKWYRQTKHAVYYVLGFIEALLGFRLLFKLLGANPASGFASFIYTITGILVAPFSGIFGTVRSEGYALQAVFEPGTVVAMIVYALIAWGIVNLLRIRTIKG